MVEVKKHSKNVICCSIPLKLKEFFFIEEEDDELCFMGRSWIDRNISKNEHSWIKILRLTSDNTKRYNEK